MQVYHDKTWGSVCNSSSFTPQDGAVICHTLGFNGYNGMVACPSTLGGTMPVWRNGLSCGANAKHINDCQRTFGNHDCVGHESDVGVECEGMSIELMYKKI